MKTHFVHYHFHEAILSLMLSVSLTNFLHHFRADPNGASIHLQHV